MICKLDNSMASKLISRFWKSYNGYVGECTCIYETHTKIFRHKGMLCLQITLKWLIEYSNNTYTERERMVRQMWENVNLCRVWGRVYGNSLYQFCSFFISLKLSPNSFLNFFKFIYLFRKRAVRGGGGGKGRKKGFCRCRALPGARTSKP